MSIKVSHKPGPGFPVWTKSFDDIEAWELYASQLTAKQGVAPIVYSIRTSAEHAAILASRPSYHDVVESYDS